MLLKLQSFNPSWFSATSASNSGPEKPSPAFPFKSSTFCFLLNLSGFSANSRRTAVPRSQEIIEPGGVEGGKGHCSLSRYFLNSDGQASQSTALRGTLSSIVSSLGSCTNYSTQTILCLQTWSSGPPTRLPASEIGPHHSHRTLTTSIYHESQDLSIKFLRAVIVYLKTATCWGWDTQALWVFASILPFWN